MRTTYLFSLVFMSISTFAADPDFKKGDMIFHRSTSNQAKAIASATGSEMTHVGIIDVDRSGQKWVVEAVGPVRRIPLGQWVKEGRDQRFALFRHAGVDARTADRIIAAALSYKGRPYDGSFYLADNAQRIYCSELVLLAYAAVGIDVGDLQKVGELNLRSREAKALFASRWRSHPVCIEQRSRTLNECLPHILATDIITPVGLTKDSKVRQIYPTRNIWDRISGQPPLDVADPQALR